MMTCGADGRAGTHVNATSLRIKEGRNHHVMREPTSQAGLRFIRMPGAVIYDMLCGSGWKYMKATGNDAVRQASRDAAQTTEDPFRKARMWNGGLA
jgi:hypothetical protein